MVAITNLSFLIVDDVAMVRDFLRQTLVNMGANSIFEASTGEGGMQSFNKNLPDIIFLDIELPKSNGQQILKEMRLIKPNAFVVMVSAHSSADNVKTSIELGASGFVVKPFTSQKIRSVLKRYMQNK
ncbi:response regulator [Psychrosphaera sp. 1_MG-2023]|uniref:response regulator n=1 Tax=Psychrosphaera sp. 1_MG-2023 TaxID=3062643 RepID=UPI0026E3BF60|nr:response regulator [Psychrosphaera sp. 1_MG-2023]MDO6718364.1 response regulator [Psychrosphaera sp. 1_MG-2023]